MVNKIRNLFLIFIMVFICFPAIIEAKTLDEYVAEAEAKLKQERATAEQKQMTEEEKKKALAEKDTITNEISSIKKEISSLEKDIKKLEEEIAKKDDEIKKLISFVQITNGESSYLEYIFGAKDFTDFIYRISVAEQLSDYNDSLMAEYNDSVKAQEQKQDELSQKQKNLSDKNKELQTLINKLSKEIDELNDNVQTYQAEYENLMNYVNLLRSKNCRGNDTLESCEARLNPPKVTTGGSSGGGSSNPGSVTGGGSGGFYIPLTKGTVTQNYYGNNHNAIDITNYEGAPVYAITTGTVLTVSKNQSCGKNIVYIWHNVNGKDYTTVYYHLKTVTVSAGQTVYYTTQIGTQGGNPSYDSCSTGSHLDFKLFEGRYLRDFFTLSRGPHIDPRTWLPQLPGEWKRFYSR